MKTFNDSTGRVWSVSLNVDAIKRVRTLVDVDLMQAVGGKLLERLTTDPVLLCDVLYAVCKAEADAKNISDEEFGRALAGDAIDAATTALLEELVDFFPQARRGLLSKAITKLRKLESRALAAANAYIESPEIDREMQKALDEAFEKQIRDERGVEPEANPTEPDALLAARAPGFGS